MSAGALFCAVARMTGFRYTEWMNSEQAGFLLNIFSTQLKNEHAATKRVIQAVPVDKGDYAPDPKSTTALDLAWHLAASEIFFVETVGAGAFPKGDGKRPESIRNAADVAAWYGETFPQSLERARQAQPGELVKELNFHDIFVMPAISWLQFAVSHSIHHRGQLSAYLRPMGAQVPSIYGPSGDSATA